jgi:hypothetical protein
LRSGRTDERHRRHSPLGRDRVIKALGASGLEARPIVKGAFLGVPYLSRPDGEKRSAENYSDSAERKKTSHSVPSHCRASSLFPSVEAPGGDWYWRLDIKNDDGLIGPFLSSVPSCLDTRRRKTPRKRWVSRRARLTDNLRLHLANEAHDTLAALAQAVDHQHATREPAKPDCGACWALPLHGVRRQLR